MKKENQSRRNFFKSLTGLSATALLFPFDLMASERGKVKITDIKTMIFEGPKTGYAHTRTYTLVKVETDSGHFGIAEAYGTPGLGIKEGVQEAMKFMTTVKTFTLPW